MAKESREFAERSKLIELQEKADKQKHEWKMEEIEYQRESNRLFHERELERGRIRRAEERKLILFKNQEYKRH